MRHDRCAGRSALRPRPKALASALQLVSPLPPPHSATYQRLRHYIAERMRMSHVVQPLMLMEGASRQVV